MGTQMDRLVEEHFKELKKRCSLTALDENSKTVEKRKSLDCNLLTEVKGMKSLAEPRSWDLKSVKVLVERTKFNEMQVVDLDRNTHSPIKIPNGRLHKTPQNRRRSAKKKPALAAAPQRQCLDEHFKARRCYVKVSKDKQLMKLLHSEPVPDEQKRTRGRPKKQKKVEVADEEPSTAASTTEHAVPALSTSNNLKRKHIDTTDAGIQSKRARKNKSSEFFINIDSLICSPSPRRKSIKSNIPEETKRRGRRSGTLVSLVTLRHKFGNRYFRSFVKVKRHREKERPAVDETPVEGEVKKKKKGKNLSVSFLETVEIFGESSEGEDWPDYDEPSFSGKASRLKRLDNGALVEDDFAKCSATSTPFTASRTSQSSDESANSPNKPDGILKRKEKISFSPLKEDDPSPRKEQLKLANEKIVRLSFEQQPAEEEEPETVSPSSRQNTTESQLTTAKDADTALQEEEEEGEVETQEETQTVANTSQDPEPVELETELITPPPSEDKNEENPETTERDDDVVPTEAEVEAESEVDNEKEVEEERQTGEEEQQRDEENEENLENKTNLEEDTTQTNTNDEISRTLSENDKEGVDSFESAVDVPNAEENSASEGDATKDKPLELIVNDVDEGKVEDASTDVDLIEEPSIESPNTTEANSSRTKADNDEEDLISETTNQVNISNSSDQQFEDASELIATVPLTEPVEPDQTDVDAVLNDVCQLVVGVNSTLLSEHNHDEFESPHNVPTVIGDDVDDFTSVLTHPEVERSLQSAASSTLVPNSQEIVVAAAVSSQAAMVPPSDVDVTEDTFARVVAEVERFAKDVNPEIYSESVGITGTDVMMDNVQARHSLDDIFDDDVDDDIISTLRMSSGSIDICHDKSLPIQVIETEVMAIPNEPDMIFDKPLGTTASILGTSMNSANDTLNTGCGHSSTADASSKLSLGRIFQSVKSYVMSPKDKHTALKD